jgi:lipopolysaccharide/colanic/teichoic acid biosynthesis glycosyltransferase
VDAGLRDSSGYAPWKAATDILVALVLLVLAAPVILVAALLVKLTSRGPAFYSQVRLGRGGRTFRIYKLRSMRHNCERQSGPCWSTTGDPRITWLGRVLRPLHIDELPQLWNVLRGEMSLVGPRPERPEFAPALANHIPFYGARLQVRPGITGLAQVQLPADTDLASVRRKLAYDVYYVQHYSPWLDLQILVATGWYAVRLPYVLIRGLTGLPRSAAIEQCYERLNVRARFAAPLCRPDSDPDLLSLQAAPCLEV